MADDTADELAELEQQLLSSLPEEVQFLADLVQVGMDAEDFRRSPAGRRFFAALTHDMREALVVLVDPARPPDEHAAALRKLQVSRAALASILGAIEQGRLAANRIDDV